MVSTPIAPALSPRDWCYRILHAIRRQNAQRREARSLETLLSYFIELNPSADDLTALLARYVSDPRTELAKAALLLQRAWQRAQLNPGLPLHQPHQEALRTVGALLDEWGAQVVYVALNADLSQLHIFCEQHQVGALSHLRLGPEQLCQEIAARTALRGQVAGVDPTSIARYETRLRVIGAELDANPPQAYTVLVTPRTIVVEGSAGYYRMSTSEGMAPELRAIAGQRQTEA
jgi:hypothetical protein